MELSLYESCRKKRLTLTYAIAVFAIALFYAAVCTPIRIWSYSNILVVETVFPIVWDVVTTTVNYLFYWVSFTFMLYFFTRFTVKNSKSMLAIYLGAVVFWYPANLLSSCLMNGFADLRLVDLIDILIGVGFDTAQMALAALLTWRFLKPAQDRAICAARERGSAIQLPKHLPLATLFDFKNPLQRSAFVASAVSAGTHIATRIYYDLSFLGGAPRNTADLLWMIFSYVSELLAFLVGYFVILLLLNYLDARETAKKEKYER